MVRIVFLCAMAVVVLLLLFSRRSPEKPRGDHENPATISQDAGSAPPASTGPDIGALAAALAASIPEGANHEQLFAATCAACHGGTGEGNEALQAPSIAGLPAWFSTIQLEKFRNGQRGENDADVSGAHMVTIAKALPEDSIEPLAEHIASLPIGKTTVASPGDTEMGKQLFLENCAGCHRYNAHGEKAFRSAPLSGLQDWYLISTLKKYREGQRGYHRYDIDGIFMQRNLKYLTDEDFHEIVSYISVLADQYPPDERRPGRKGRDSAISPLK